MTFIMSINGTLQLFDESVNLTKGTCQYDYYHVTLCIQHMFYQCAKLWICGSHVILIFIMVAILAFINLKVGDTRD